MSPSFPQPYQPSQDCEWSFNVTGHYRLQLTFTTFALQPAASNGVCTADYVDVRNGTTSAAPTLGKFCGSPTIPMLESGNNQMYVKFHSDASSNSYQGFRASYNSGKILEGPSVSK